MRRVSLFFALLLVLTGAALVWQMPRSEPASFHDPALEITTTKASGEISSGPAPKAPRTRTTQTAQQGSDSGNFNGGASPGGPAPALPAGVAATPAPPIIPPALANPAALRATVARITESTLLQPSRTGVERPPIEQVLLMEFHMTKHNVRLLSAIPRPGRPARTRAGSPLGVVAPGVVIRALDKDGSVVWQDAIEDPRIFRCCYEHADGAGLLTGHIEITESASFTVRVPHLEEITTISLYRNARPVESLSTVTIEENLLGRFSLRK